MSWHLYKEQINTLAHLPFNYDEKLYHEAKDKSGWFIDRYQASLAVEPPGEPIKDGPFETVKNAIRLYQFPDPKLIRAVFDPDSALVGRDMLMLARFMGFNFRFGVRVTSEVNEVCENKEGENVRHWGYSYRTLQGHFEVGEIRFEVAKNLETGRVLFEIDAYSKPGRIPNLFYRVGFKIFGRSLQKYFAKSSIERLREISEEALSKNKLKQDQANSTDRHQPNH